MIFETYIFVYPKIRIVHSNSLGLFMYVFAIVSLLFTSGRVRCMQIFSKRYAIEKDGILKTNT